MQASSCEGWLQPCGVSLQLQGRPCGQGGLQPRLTPAVLCTGASEKTLYSLHTPLDFSAPMTLRTAFGSPVDTPCIHTGHNDQGAGWVSGSPHLGLLTRGAVEAKVVKPKNLLRRLCGRPACMSSSRQLSGNRPQECWAWFSQAKSQVFHVASQEQGQVPSSGWACQHQLWRVFVQMHVYSMSSALAYALGHPAEPWATTPSP